MPCVPGPRHTDIITEKSSLHQTLFRAAKVHARICAKDQTIFNIILSNNHAYQTVPVHILARTLTATCT